MAAPVCMPMYRWARYWTPGCSLIHWLEPGHSPDNKTIDSAVTSEPLKIGTVYKMSKMWKFVFKQIYKSKSFLIHNVSSAHTNPSENVKAPQVVHMTLFSRDAKYHLQHTASKRINENETYSVHFHLKLNVIGSRTAWGWGDALKSENVSHRNITRVTLKGNTTGWRQLQL